MNKNTIQTDAILKSFIHSAVPVIKQDFAVSKVIIFGSRVKGSATDESGIDAIVVSDRNVSLSAPDKP